MAAPYVSDLFEQAVKIFCVFDRDKPVVLAVNGEERRRRKLVCRVVQVG